MDFSIIIPTCNSEKHIKSCLDSVFSLNYPKKSFEVIVVDGSSKDKTLDIIKKYRVKLVHTKNISISDNRNVGAAKAKGRNLVFIDSDCFVNKDLLKKSKEYLKKYDCCGSFYKSHQKQGWIAKTWILIEGKKKGIVDWVPSGTLVVKKNIFEKLNGFNKKLQTGEDFDFCYRLRKKGHKIFNDPSIASIHLGQTDSIKDFFKNELWRGNALLRGIKEHGLLKEELFSTLITFYHFIVILFFLVSLFLLKLSFYPLVLSLLLLLLPSLLLTIRAMIKSRSIYFVNFYVLIFIYQIARAFSLVRPNKLKG